MALNKSDLIKQIAQEAGIKSTEAEKAVKAFTQAISNELKNENGSVSLIGFGTFSRSQRSARTGKNPRTGESINIPEKSVVKFKAGKTLSGLVAGMEMEAPAAKKETPKKSSKK